MWKRLAGYGLLLGMGTFALQFADYQRLARAHADGLYGFLLAAAFLGLGIYVGARLFGVARPAPFDGNPNARAALRLSPRELTILHEVAAGRSTKEIAARLEVSPNTVKTHLAHWFDKLGAKRRTEAIHKARELGIVP